MGRVSDDGRVADGVGDDGGAQRVRADAGTEAAVAGAQPARANQTTLLTGTLRGSQSRGGEEDYTCLKCSK